MALIQELTAIWSKIQDTTIMAEVAFTSNPQDQKNLDNYIHYITSMGAVVHTRLKEAAQSHLKFNRKTQ